MIYNIDAMCSHMVFKLDELHDTVMNKDLTHYKEHSKACKGLIYQAVQENVTYFKKYHLNDISITLDFDVLARMSFEEMCEFQDRWSNSIKGFYGREYDNLQRIYLVVNGKTCSLSLIRNQYEHKTIYIFSLWNINDATECYFETRTENKELTVEEIKKIKERV